MPTGPLAQTLAKLREELAVSIITNVGVSPMDRQMGNQGEANQFCKLDCFDDVGCLRDRNVFGATNPVCRRAHLG